MFRVYEEEAEALIVRWWCGGKCIDLQARCSKSRDSKNSNRRAKCRL